MQDVYVANIGDFGKYGLLRVLFGKPEKGEIPAHGLQLGVVWYYTQVGGDGGSTNYLRNQDPFASFDQYLYKRLNDLVSENRRRVLEVENEGFLLVRPENYFREELVLRNQRNVWIEQACEGVANVDLVFLDPDIGIEPQGRGTVQHIRINEIERIYNSGDGKSLIVYQHRNREQPNVQIRLLGNRLRAEGKFPCSIRVFFWHNRFFIVFVHPNHQALNPALDDFQRTEWCTSGHFTEETHWLGNYANYRMPE